MKLKNRNSLFQSCRYCFVGGSLYRVDSDEGTFYICEKHKNEKDFLKELLVEGIEDDLPIQTIGFIRKAINYIKGG